MRTNTETTFNRKKSSGAPAYAPARTRTSARPKAGHTAPSLANPFSAQRPVESDIPVLGHRETLTRP